MRRISAPLRRRVLQRAGSRCEYCGLSQIGQVATFHVDHVIPIAAGGETVLGNLALACVSCSLREGARRTAPDPESGEDVPLYNPRRAAWPYPFRWEGVRVVGLTPTGRATVAALDLNRASMREIRAEEILFGRHPPEWEPRAR